MMLIASKQAAVAQLNNARDLPAMRGFDDELRMLARRRRTQPPTLALPNGELHMDMQAQDADLLLLLPQTPRHD